MAEARFKYIFTIDTYWVDWDPAAGWAADATGGCFSPGPYNIEQIQL